MLTFFLCFDTYPQSIFSPKRSKPDTFSDYVSFRPLLNRKKLWPNDKENSLRGNLFSSWANSSCDMFLAVFMALNKAKWNLINCFPRRLVFVFCVSLQVEIVLTFFSCFFGKRSAIKCHHLIFEKKAKHRECPVGVGQELWRQFVSWKRACRSREISRNLSGSLDFSRNSLIKSLLGQLFLSSSRDIFFQKVLRLKRNTRIHVGVPFFATVSKPFSVSSQPRPCFYCVCVMKLLLCNPFFRTTRNLFPTKSKNRRLFVRWEDLGEKKGKDYYRLQWVLIHLV